MSSPMIEISGRWIGPIAKRMVAWDGPCEVLAVFPAVIYLKNNAGVFAVGAATIEPGPLTIVADTAMDFGKCGLRAGQKAHVANRFLRIAQLRFRLAPATPWMPHLTPFSGHETLRRKLDKVRNSPSRWSNCGLPATDMKQSS